MWQFPWGYRESFSFIIGIVIVGLLLQIVAPIQIPNIHFPYNVIIGFNVFLLPFAITLLFKNNSIVKWLSSVPAAVSSIVLLSVLSLFMGFVPQNQTMGYKSIILGFDTLLHSWLYSFSLLYFYVTLGMVTARRTIPFRKANIGFILNHLGLLITVFSMSLGAGDKEKISISLSVDKTEWVGYNQEYSKVELPFALHLTKFTIEDYNPSLVIIDNATGEPIDDKKHSHQFLVDSGKITEIHSYKITIEKFLPDATFFDSVFVEYKSKGSVPAAYINITSPNGDVSKGWITCGNFITPMMIVRIDRFNSVAMTIPAPKLYRSNVRVYTPDEKYFDTVIEVNKPIEVNGWKIYQTGFDESMGKWSNTSILQAVRDPWLPMVYVGICMLIAGAFVLFWDGNKIKPHSNIK